MSRLIENELRSAKKTIQESQRGTLIWFLACQSWNRALVSSEGYLELLEKVGAPSNVDLDEGFAITREYDLHQPLRKLN